MNYPRLGLGMVVVAFAGLALAQDGIPWKATREHRPTRPVVTKTKNLRSQHRIIHFPDVESARAGRARLEERGFRILRYLPERSFVVSAPPTVTSFEGISIDSFDAWMKLSPDLTEDEEYFLIEFHPDVDNGDARSIVLETGFEIVENLDLMAEHLLVKGTLEKVRALASYDETAYIFPASEDLIAGRQVSTCSGAITDQGTVGQYVVRVGEGWDGAGARAATLTYAFGTLTNRLDPASVKTELRRAMAEWAKVAQLTFNETTDQHATRSIVFLFATGEHGDGYPFDGPSKVLAHTFYPAPPNTETIAGDMHFDDAEYWRVGSDIDLFSVALHEMGHALGLGHSDKPTAVMYPYYQRVTTLTDEDKNAILALYAAQVAGPLAVAFDSSPAASTAASTIALSGTATGGVGDAVVRWSNSRGGSGTAQGGRIWYVPAIPLVTGLNTITVTATDTGSSVATRSFTIQRGTALTPVQLVLTTPSANPTVVGSTPFTIRGTASHTTGITQVTWRTGQGATGTATGTTNWSASIPLQAGLNTITVTAVAGNSSSGVMAVQLTYNSAANPDRTAPSIVVASPTTATVSTRNPSITITGTASDNVGVAQVNWTNSSGGVGVATGTTSWSTGPIALLIGSNVITIRAKDSTGNQSWRTVIVTRQR